ncbi:metal-dependent hydrolase [Paraliomyxa miuraensis]|uniref:metal-dependent hydrolase n=1 Tax=Paraliomyxa miuraensis TaxID=376150 RepID=UPI0022542F43|nr:metal-dependent hydrolase [Paraliomyxa miuraensis]MCX4247291.1 metal-dependent hydrolase [Paraliomyxa miuraensis]
MDPLTQGLLGAAAAQALLGRRLGRRAWLYGAIGGMAADLDVLIRSADDPLVGFRFHRHFTHSLAFIPVGGVISALPFVLRKRYVGVRRDIILGTTAGYATHALLDAFTSYGTMLWWPFSDARVAWSWVAIVDPIYTGILAAGVLLSARWTARPAVRSAAESVVRGRAAMRPARVALLLSSLYLLFGCLQRSRVLEATRGLARARGHAIARIDAYPSPPANLVWRTTYQSEGQIWVDQVRVPWWGPATTREGGSVPLLAEAELPDAIRGDPATLRGFRVFQWFARGWVAWDPHAPHVVGDLRYGAQGDASTSSMWGVRLEPGGSPPVSAHRADLRASLAERWDVLLGRDRAP